MKSQRKTIQKLVSEESSEATNETIGKVELVIETRRSSRIFFLRATREGCQIMFKWSRLVAGITAVVALIVGTRKYLP
jgi:hypothetical protein